jgi:Cu-Zn family superoxide dismutase
MRTPLAILSLCLLAAPAFAKAKDAVVVPLKTSSGQDAGTATFKPTKKGISIQLDLKNLPIGDHAVHIHQNPACDAPDFKTAGGHFNPDSKQHGTMNPMGHHAGDLPQNVSFGEQHTAQISMKVNYLSLDPASPNSIFGHSIMVHEKADDMKTDPTGNAGNRIACGVISAPTP